MTTGHVAIVGGGFSGALLAVNLLRHDGPRATLIERGSVAGEGVAYGAAHAAHLLNVRAGNMSAFPDEPDHFVRWLTEQGEAAGPQTFVPRRTYGRYLRSLLQRALLGCGGRLTLMQGDVVEVTQGAPACAMLADGRRVEADAVVLAVGNLPPHTPVGSGPGPDLDALPPARYVRDPWHPREAGEEQAGRDWAGLDRTGRERPGDVLILGTGLTMVDVVLRLAAEGFAGRIVAMSRRGLVPRAHGDAGGAGQVSGRLAERPTSPASGLVRMVRARAEAAGWRHAVDELRPFTQDMWRAAPADERARFLRHLRPWWDVHRHRLAPEVAAKLAAMIADGRLRIVAGKLDAVDERPDGLAVRWRERGSSIAQALTVQRIINCTGPQGDLLRTADPLLRRLVDRGDIRPDDCRIGIDVDPQSRTVSRSGRENDWLLAIGPMTRGAFWEIVAVPDIRSQVWTLSRRLSHAQWVEGEGL
ncbi:MAG: FAD/NAD(P)-binding protein [Janthinobacterium lividum]